MLMDLESECWGTKGTNCEWWKAGNDTGNCLGTADIPLYNNLLNSWCLFPALHVSPNFTSELSSIPDGVVKKEAVKKNISISVILTDPAKTIFKTYLKTYKC